MESNNEFGNITFDLPKNQSNVIKVIGVGGGGSNAINHMFKQGIKGVDFVICNTDSQALLTSPVPNKIQLGVTLTEGLGAGAKPEVGYQAAMESMEEIEKMLGTNTKMVFITAGMGGGTGTGAAPVIAQLAKEKQILTVGIVTIPFQFEGKSRCDQAMEGVEELRRKVDSLIVINNNKLREVYGNLGWKAGFSKADEVLATASKGIAELITNHLTMNIDLKDAKTVLSDSGTAIMGSAVAEGEGRAKMAIVSALDSPLLNDNKITGAKNVLLLLTSGAHEITIDEISEINEHIQSEAGHNANIIMGIGEDDKLGDAIAVTIIATGFTGEQQIELVNLEPKKIIHALEGEQQIVHNLTPNSVPTSPLNTIYSETVKAETAEPKIVHNLEEIVVPVAEVVATPTNDLVVTTEYLKNLDVFFELVSAPVAPVQQVIAEVKQPIAETFAFTAPVVTNVVTPQFEILTSQIKEIEVIEPQFVIEPAFDFSVDLFSEPTTHTQNEIVFEVSNETKEMHVTQPVQVFPVTEINEQGIVRYTLEEEIETVQQQPAAELNFEPVMDQELNFTLKHKPEVTNTEAELADMLLTAEERKRKLKMFNHKFGNSHRIEDLEKEPAYKRLGLDVTSMPEQNTNSRMSLGLDTNNEVQIRNNNSFLHDNVD